VGRRHGIDRNLGAKVPEGGGCRAAVLVHQFLKPDAPEGMLGFAGLLSLLIAAGHLCSGCLVGIQFSGGCGSQDRAVTLPPLLSSIFFRQQDRGHASVPLGDDVEAVARGSAITTQEPGAMFEGVLVGLLVLRAKFLAPIAAMMTAEVARKLNVQGDRSGGGKGLPQREARLHQVVRHGISGCGL